MTELKKYSIQLARLDSIIKEKNLYLTTQENKEKLNSINKTQNITISGRNSEILVSEGVDINDKTKIEILAHDAVLIIGAGVKLINCNIRVRGSGHIIHISNDCRLKQLNLHLNGKNNTVGIGSGSTVEQAIILCEADDRAVLLGNDCMLSSNIMIRTSDGHGVFDAATGERLSLPADVIIHAHVWIGNGARVSKGCVIETGSIIGQMALATGHVESNCIYGGVPAKKIREGIVWSRTHRMDDIPEEFTKNTKMHDT
ncbi:acyltransferase [Gluconacetobacter tumulisoli]|uniref:Acyltransferase n=1 Tax=Gluconacetobacter tumulisoli TaxID=1286189 RepID=A0A7W4K5I0_9PROT|nr:hypothetical protein [Gluconacetobacter tumulisoli]MBB2200780.1 hypothetical protein [Gluconacetobacter tumulisoli]